MWGYGLVSAALAYASFASGATGGGGVSLDDPLGGKGFQELLKGVLRGITQLAAPVVAIMVLVGGFQIMTARGNEEKVSEGRKTITYAVVGFAIILLADAVASIIRNFVLGTQ